MSVLKSSGGLWDKNTSSKKLKSVFWTRHSGAYVNIIIEIAVYDRQ